MSLAMHKNQEFPRLHVDLPEVRWRFAARRWPFGPCTVVQEYSVAGEPFSGNSLVLPVDWHGPDAAWLAREMLWKAKCRNDGEISDLFVAEVLATLPRDGWVLTRDEVREWGARFEPPPPPPPPELDDHQEMLRELDMLDEEERSQEDNE